MSALEHDTEEEVKVERQVKVSDMVHHSYLDSKASWDTYATFPGC